MEKYLKNVLLYQRSWWRREATTPGGRSCRQETPTLTQRNTACGGKGMPPLRKSELINRKGNTLRWLYIIQQDRPGYIHNCAVNCFFRGRTCLRLVLM